jgi:glucose 1-dehydrogenase
MPLSGQVVIVTGGAQGIGRACAERFAKEGAKVVIADMNEKAGAAAAKAISEAGGTARFIGVNVAERLDVHNLIAATLEVHGQLNALVACAGIFETVPFLELEEADFDRVIATNLKGSFLCGQAAARQMVKQCQAGGPPGTIVNISSVNAHFGMADHAAYATSKGGVRQLTRSMAIALAPHGIRVNAIGPGTIETAMSSGLTEDKDMLGTVLGRTPLGRLGKPEEIAAVAAWLISSEASYLTGETIYADGGRIALNLVMPKSEGK